MRTSSSQTTRVPVQGSSGVRWDNIAKLGRQRPGRRYFDLVVVDLIDEFFPLAGFCEGAICTISNEFVIRDAGRSAYLNPQPMTGTALGLWRAGRGTLLNLMEKAELTDRIVVHQANPLERTASGVLVMGLRPDGITKANAWLGQTCTHVETTPSETCLLRVTNKSRVSFADYRWGMAPFH
ncbi:hypothetical protein GCM10028787_06120 [Brachybacterium horti]